MGMNFRRVSASIVTRLLLLSLCFVVAAAGLRYYFLVNFVRDDLLTVVRAQQEALAQDMARDVDYKIVERRSLLNQMALSMPVDLLKQPVQLGKWLAARHAISPLFSNGLFVTGLDGVALIDYPRLNERVGTSFGDRDYVRGALGGQFTIGRAVVGRVSREPVLPMATPIKDASGHVVGVLAGITTLDTPGFLEPIHRGHIGQSGGFLLISPKDQIFIAATMQELTLKATAPPGVNPLHDRALAGYRGSGITVNAQGVEEVSAVASVPSTGWFVVARLPTSEALALVSHTRQKFYVMTVAGAIVVLTVLTLALMAMFRPLIRTVDLAERMTRGEIPLQRLPVNSSDEIGYLTESFNKLLDKLLVSQEELTRMARYDALTGLSNRLHLSERVSQDLARARRTGGRVALLFLDLDGFKLINDELGHEAGDEALIEVTQRLSVIVREVDILARVGGDEFVIVLSDLDASRSLAERAACAVAAKCIDALQPPILLRGGAPQLGLSIGIALGDGHSTLSTMMQTADNAMYSAKKAGRGRYVVAAGGV